MATKKKSTELTTYLLMLRDGTKRKITVPMAGTFQGVKDGL